MGALYDLPNNYPNRKKMRQELAELPSIWREGILYKVLSKLPNQLDLDKEVMRWRAARAAEPISVATMVSWKYTKNQREICEKYKATKKAADSVFDEAMQDSLDEAAAEYKALTKLCSGRLSKINISHADIRAVAEGLEGKMRSLRRMMGAKKIKSLHAIGRGLCAEFGLPEPRITGSNIEPAIERLCCKYWWARSIRTARSRNREYVGIQLGQVGQKGKKYCSDSAAEDWEKNQARQRAWLEAQQAVNEQGHIFTLAQLADAGIANPANRRAELMLRIKGFDELAREQGHVGEFVTLTTPSRYHPWLQHGGRNPKYEGASPKDAQAYMLAVWARIRAKLVREGIQIYGIRVAEPHHDATPHWHLLLFMRSCDDYGRRIVPRFRAIVRKYAMQDSPNEQGAKKRRAYFVAIDHSKGSAAAYVAKYIAKGMMLQDATNNNQKPKIWASIWGIKQFVFIGGATINLWRTIRKTKLEALEGAPELIKKAHEAANRRGDIKASWAEFSRLIGGVLCSRRDAALMVVREEDQNRIGRYGERLAGKIIGLCLSFLPQVLYKCNTYRFRLLQGSAEPPPLVPV